MVKLLTKKDLAERWQVTERTVDNYIKDKIVQPVKGIPVIRFTEQHIAELEGIKIDKMSPLERRRLEHEVEKLKIENDKLKNAAKRALTEILKATQVNILNE